ncbi:MAG TPA: class I SAM-dependent methyltransferase [Actinomycetota bacterium]|nr:class I SAM-dependent methyltransferase [Actinomycetota bacterium]
MLARHYDSEAALYEELWAPVLALASKELLNSLPLKEADRIVDVGSGVGTLLPAIQKGAPQATVIAVDRSPGMLQRASPVFARVIMDATALGFRPGAFDVAIMTFVLFHLSDPLHGLKETRRVLKRGGAIGTITWGKAATCPALGALASRLDMHHAHPDPCPPQHELINDPAEIVELFKAAGFAAERAWGGWIEHEESRDTFLRRVTGSGPIKRRLELLSPEARRYCLRGADEDLAKMPPEGFQTRRQVVFATARVPDS